MQQETTTVPEEDPDEQRSPQSPSRTERVIAEAEQRKRTAQPPDARTYALARILGKVVFGICTAAQVTGLEYVPPHGPLLIVANHLSYLEPPLIATAIPRRITFLAGHELYEIGWLAWVLRTMGALPVRRGGARDLDAIRAAVELLKRGEAVGIFPEGQITEQPVLKRAKPGLSLLAYRANAPILPIAISGTEHLSSVTPFLTARFREPRVQVQIGQPFLPDFGPGKPDHQAVADAVMRRIAALLPAQYRGEYHS